MNQTDTEFPALKKDRGKVIVISGGRGIGKTSYCQKVVSEYRRAGSIVSGIITPGRFENNKKDGIYSIDLAGHESKLLASLRPGEIEGVQFGAWTFDSNVMDWGNKLLHQIQKTHLLVIDELGYLEFDLNFGWTSAFEVLNKRNFQLALVVIRPECIEQFSAMGYSFQIQDIHHE